MEITPEINAAWAKYWATMFSESALIELYCACGQNGPKMVEVIHALSGSQDTVMSSHHYRGGVTQVPFGFQFK